MCISSRIKKYLAEKEALDARIAKLEKLEAATAPVKNLLSELLADYAKEAPEDLAEVWEEVLAIGQQHNLSKVQTEIIQLTILDELALAELRSQFPNSISKDDDVEKYLNPTPEAEEEAQATGFLQIGDTFSSVPEYESEESRDSIALGFSELVNQDAIESILTGKGFFQPNDHIGDYALEELYETYRGWDVFYSLPNGGIVSIGLYYPEHDAIWDASTEYIQEIDSTFPESLADFDEIVAWTRALIDRVENLEAPGQLALEFPDPTSEQIEEELGCNWKDEDEVESKAASEEIVGKEAEIESKDQEAPIFFKVGDRYQWNGDEEDREQGLTGFINRISKMGNIAWTPEGSTIERLLPPEMAQRVLSPIVEVTTSQEPAKPKTEDEPTAAKIKKWGSPQETDTDFEAMGFNVQVYPQHAGEELVGATFRFLKLDNGTLEFSKSLVAAEIGDRTWKVCAWDLIQDYRDKEAARVEKEQNPYKKPEDDFIELVKLSPAVGYIKRRDNGELLAAYAAFANRNAAGEKTATMAKPRAKKWAEHLHASFESCGWKVEEPRKINRMVNEPSAKQQFAYEIKITGKFSIGQLQKLAEEDFSLLPNESAPNLVASSLSQAQVPSNKVYRVKVNSYELAQGTEEEMRSRFNEEVKILGDSQMSVSLVVGSEVIEGYRVRDFEFTQVTDFDAANPEYEVVYHSSQKSFKVYKRLTMSPELDGWTNSVYPYTPGFIKREAAAVDAVRRLLKAESAE